MNFENTKRVNNNINKKNIWFLNDKFYNVLIFGKLIYRNKIKKWSRLNK